MSTLSRYSGPIVTKWLEGPYKSRPFVVYKDVWYWTDVDGGHSLHIPKDYRGDGLSVPWVFTRLFPRTGSGRTASLPHDILCDPYLRPDWCTSSDMAADVFDEALEYAGVSKLKRKLMVWAVRHYGPQWGNTKEKKNNGKTKRLPHHPRYR